MHTQSVVKLCSRILPEQERSNEVTKYVPSTLHSVVSQTFIFVIIFSLTFAHSFLYDAECEMQE
jgi:hypothetical protein